LGGVGEATISFEGEISKPSNIILMVAGR